MQINQVLFNNGNLFGLVISIILCCFGYFVLKNTDKYIEKEIKIKKTNYEKNGQPIFKIPFNENYYRTFAKIFIPLVGTIFFLSGFLGIISMLYELIGKSI